MRKYYVYMYTDNLGTPLYIGKGSGKRWQINRHIYDNSHPFLKRKILKIGVTNVRVIFLNQELSEDSALQWECYWISYIGRKDIGAGTLCNLTDGGEGTSGHRKSLNERKAMSQRMLGRTLPRDIVEKIATKKRGIKLGPHSTEHKQKISAALMGRTYSDEYRRKQSIAQTGKHRRIGLKHSEEARKKMSIASRLRWSRRSNND